MLCTHGDYKWLNSSRVTDLPAIVTKGKGNNGEEVSCMEIIKMGNHGICN